MPRMPDWTDVRSAPNVNTGEVRRAARSAIPAAVGRLGEEIGRSHDEKLELGLRANRKARDETDALELARARSDWNSRRLNEDDQYDISKNPKLDKWESGYDSNIKKHKSASSGIISNPQVRAQFEAGIEDDITTGRLNIRGRKEGIEKNTRRASGLAAIEDNLSLATRPGIDQKEADKIISQSHADIDNMVMVGVLTPAEAIEKRRALPRQYAVVKAQQDIQADPGNAYRHLNGNPGEVYFKKLRGKENAKEDPKARPRHKDGSLASTAVGYYQILDGTWADLMKRHPELGLTKDGRGNREQEEKAIRAFTKDSAAALSKSGLPASEANLRLTQFMGEGGGPKMLNADPSANAAKMFPDAAAANPTIFYKDGAPRSVGEVIALQTRGFSTQDGPAPEYYQFLEPDDRIRLSSAAEGEWAAQEKVTRETNDLERYQLKSSLDDDVAQIESTGQASDISPQTVVDTLGESDAAKWLEKRNTAAQTYSAVTVMDSMSNDDMDQHLSSLEPSVGTENFGRAQKIYEAAESKSRKVQDLRTKDPAFSVESSPIVQEAQKNLKPDDPTSVQGLVKARLAAQQQVGIPDVLQQPITRREAKEIIAPIEKLQLEMGVALATSNAQNIDPASRKAATNQIKAQANDQIRATIDQIDAAYGPYADKVLIAALMASSQDKETANMTAIVLRKMAKGEKPSVSDGRAMDVMQDTKQADDAMAGEKPKVTGWGGGAKGGVRHPSKPKPSQNVYPRPPASAVQHLLKNPSIAGRFDGLFGPGAAAQWLPKE